MDSSINEVLDTHPKELYGLCGLPPKIFVRKLEEALESLASFPSSPVSRQESNEETDHHDQPESEALRASEVVKVQ